MTVDWPHICYHRSHWNNPVLATDRWELPSGVGFYACKRHSEFNGALYRSHGYIWTRLSEATQTQPSSERVQP